MAKMLNLDDLMEKEPIKVVLNGVTHVMKELNVALYVDVMKKMEALEATKSTADELELSFDIISKMVPTLSRDDLLALTQKQILALRELVFSGGASLVDSDGAPVEGNAKKGA